MIYLSIFLASFFGLAHSGPTQLPDSFARCNKSDPEIGECLKNAIQGVIPELVKGLPQYGIYSIDPLKITEFNINQGKGPVAIALNFKNLEIKGFKSAQLTGVKVDFKNNKKIIKANLMEPLILEGDYEIKGKVLILPISGKGKSVLKLDNLVTVLTISGKEVQRNGQIYFEIQKFDVKFETTRLTMTFENLFNSDKALGENMNAFLNDNWREILEEVKPSFEEALGETFKAIASRLYSKVPLKDIYL